MVGEPLVDKEEDKDVHSLRGGTSDLPRSSATKKPAHKANIQEPNQKGNFYVFL